MTDREKAIKDLEDIIATAEGIKGLSDDAGITISLDKIESLRFGLESLKTDASEDNPLYVYENKELCWDCYKEQFTQKICDDCDDTLCAECGDEVEILYLYEGEWVCEDCLRNMAERVKE